MRWKPQDLFGFEVRNVRYRLGELAHFYPLHCKLVRDLHEGLVLPLQHVRGDGCNLGLSQQLLTRGR